MHLTNDEEDPLLIKLSVFVHLVGQIIGEQSHYQFFKIYCDIYI